MTEPMVTRNKAIVVLRKLDPELYSFAVLGKLFGIKRNYAHRVYHRDCHVYLLPSEVTVGTEQAAGVYP